MKRAARYTLIGAAVVAALVLALVLVLTRTDFGVDRAGRFALDQIRGSINGELAVERMTSGGLLEGVTLHGVALSGPDGRLFLEADSARLAYRLRTLLSGSIAFDRLLVYSPTVVIERLPGEDRWNYEKIFSSDTTAPDTSTQNSLILIRDATVEDGLAIVRMPWEPEGPVAPEDTARLILEEVPGGLVRTLRFDDLRARLPRIVWEAPDNDAKLFEIQDLSTRAYVWETPAEIQSLEGSLTIRDSLVSFDAPRARLPDSELALVGRIILGEENQYDIEVEGEDLSFADFQWLYPPLPTDGGGRLRFRMQSQAPGSILWLVRDARVQTSGTEMAGSFGVVTGDTLYFTNVDLDASPLDLELLQRLVPSALPLEGLLIGTVRVEGPISALESEGDVRLRTVAGDHPVESLLRWRGTVGLAPPYAVRGLEAELRSIDLEQVAQLAPGVRVRGRATGHLEAGGSLEGGLDVTGEVALEREANRSALRGAGRFAIGGDRSAFDLRFEAEPVALDLLTEQFPGVGPLAGAAQGPVTVRGSLDDLHVDADLLTPAGGLVVRGRFGLTDTVPAYRAEGSVRDFELDRVARALPETRMTGRFEVEGSGNRPENLDIRGAVDILSARVAGVEVLPSVVRGRITDGVARFDSLALVTEVGDLTGRGSLGIVPGRSGELSFEADAHTLSRLEPVVFPESPAELDMEPDVRLAGSARVRGGVEGSVQDWRAQGRATVRDLTVDPLALASAEVEFQARPNGLTAEASVDSVRYGSRRAAHARAAVTWSTRGGRVVARARGAGPEELEADVTVRRDGDVLHVEIPQLDLSTRDGRWALADTARARLAPTGLDLHGLALVRSPDTAHIRIGGSLPWLPEGAADPQPASMVLELDRVPVDEVLRVAQSDTTVGGVVTARFRVSGTALAPRLEGRAVARPFRYGTAVLDSAAADVRYDDRVLRANVAGWQDGEALIYGGGTAPFDLALTPRSNRRLDRPMALRFRADSVPAALVSFLAPGFRDLTGAVDGELALVGTTRTPALEGRLRLVDGGGVFEPLDVRYRSIQATATMGTGRVVELDARLSAGGGQGRLTGTLDLNHPSDPAFDLTLAARELQASRRRDVSAVATGTLHVGGHYTRPVVSGEVEIVEGDMNLDEIWRQYQIVQLDPSVFQMLDSTTVRFRPPAGIPFLENMLLTNATIIADRGFWLRSRELNVEVSGRLEMEVDRMASDLRLTGTLQALDGSYALQLVQGVPGRTFDIRGGNIEFVGTPGIDPNLDIQAGYRVRRAQGDPIDVVARVSGTLKDPRVALTSDSDLQLSESDLASYILFGRSGAELTQAETDVLSSGIGLVRPVATSLVSFELQRALAGTGLPVDYVALTTPEYGAEQLGAYWQSQGLAGVFHNAQLEVGFDAGRDLSLVLSGRFPTDQTSTTEGSSFWRQFGARLEYRPSPTWTTQLYVEDRFARTPSFGFTEIDDRKVWGVSLFRDWVY